MNIGYRLLILIGVFYLQPAVAAPDYADLPGLQESKKIWMDNCEACHGYGIAGSPIPMHAEDWGFRLKKGKTVLYRHAIKGFYGPDDTVMPERGGNPDLTDEQVRAAVDYMTALARHHMDGTPSSK